ncbi:McrB family protein [Chryseobacterium sp. MMS23-Vi53]|uniref:McrB family protein n=1 Tax=Chryseobacterium sp. MMS23-Vi53 TaxID=3386644 RepID=UPI0039E8D92A
MNYHDLQIEVYKWLKSKYDKDYYFTFSVRQKASKGAEKNYFIGTERSRYFSTTFWQIPVSYPGSSTDLINLVFALKKNNKLEIYFQFYQTRYPNSQQNQYALDLIKNIKPRLKSFSSLKFQEGKEKSKMEFFTVIIPKHYDSFEESIPDLESMLLEIIPIVDEEILKLKNIHADFIAHRFTVKSQADMISRMYDRFNKYSKGEEEEIVEEEEWKIIQDFDTWFVKKYDESPGIYNGMVIGFIYQLINFKNLITINDLNNQTQETLEIVRNEIPNFDYEGLDYFDEFLNFILTKNTQIKKMKQPINQILYGPPGTGKTYNTINKALAIIENKSIDELARENRKNLKKRFNSYVNSGQIVFTTFHQSMSYEDFIEGIKPIKPKEEDNFVKYDIHNGVFKKLCLSCSKFKFKPGDKIGEYEITKIGSEILYLLKPQAKTIVPLPIYLINELYSLVKEGKITLKDIKDKQAADKMSSDTEKYIINGYPNIFPLLVEKMINVTQPDNHVIIIDEINRGNVSQIFGELITLIEEDKRLGNNEALEITLPYSKEKFSVPSNLYIIGTMNTADRSVEALDTALRRRFSFEEMPPKPDLLQSPSEIFEKLLWDYKEHPWEDDEYIAKEKELLDALDAPKGLWDKRKEIWTLMNVDKKNGNIKNGTYFKEFFNNDINFKDLLITINQRIEKLIDKDHAIGHAYFIGKNDETIIESFYKNIIPLLQEYFFGDYGKIGLVLGRGFVREKENKSSVFADFDYSSENYDEKEMYEIMDYRNDAVHLIKIKGKEVEMDFRKAIQVLMNQEIE